MKRILILMAALSAVACQPLPADGGPTPVTRTSAGDAAACAARGGEMLPQGRMQTLQCVVSYADAGQRCTDGDDCLGDCRVEDVAAAPACGVSATSSTRQSPAHWSPSVQRRPASA